MSNLISLQQEANRIADRASDTSIIKLADLIKQLCKEVERIEETANNAENQAKLAQRHARGND